MRLTVEELYKIYCDHPQIITDSRKVIPGCLFFALKGENFDGNSFASQAVAQGAAFAISDNPNNENEKIVIVNDVLETLQKLSEAHRFHLKIPVIGITGTNGKTTTKELINAVLSSHLKTHSTQGNYNNHIGVPLTLLSAPAETEVMIVEMGANHVGEIAFLCSLAKPDMGLITNIGRAHLEGFGGFEGVIKAKSELYQYLSATGGKAFVNADNALLMQLSQNLNRIMYGTLPHCDTVGGILSSDPFLVVAVKTQSGEIPISTNLVGRYNFENVLAAVCVGKAMGVPIEKVAKAITAYQPGNSRSQAIDTGKNKVIVDSYNANPSSMRAALENFSNLQAGHKMVILGDMFELGDESGQEHRTIINMVKEMKFDAAILAGTEFMKVVGSNEFTCFSTSGEARDWLKANPVSGYTILLKGSRGSRMEYVLEVL